MIGMGLDNLATLAPWPRLFRAVVMVTLVVVLGLGASAHAATVEAVPLKASGWKYKVVGAGGEPGFQTVAYDDSAFSVGTAGFGTTFAGCPWNNSSDVQTLWPANSDLLLRRSITLPTGASGVRVEGTVDNDATVYVNGQQIGAVQSGFCIGSNIDFTAPNSGLAGGTNVLAIRGHDYGGSTFLDVRVTYTAPSNRAPDCSGLTASPNLLWPPDHTFQTVTVTGATDPDGDALTYSITGVMQDEPVDAVGDANTAPDARLLSGAQLNVRAERSGTGNGRVYEIAVSVSDGKGGTCTGTVTTSVPHSQNAAPAVNDGATYSSL